MDSAVLPCIHSAGLDLLIYIVGADVFELYAYFRCLKFIAK